ncbi:uncharacterized protein ACBR49_005258 [Aulostomus maculatus]
MDEAAAAATIRTDGAEDDPLSGDGVSGNTSGPSSEDTPDRVGLFCCQDCGEAFREEATYLEHRQHHLQGKTLYLDNQSDSFQDAEKDGETTNFCSLCSLTFAELSDFHSHMKDNHGPTSQKACGAQMNSGKTKQHTYECPDCGKCYGVIGHLLNHQRSHRQASKSVFHDLEHLKKKSFQCESCGRNYSRASALDAHRRCHEGKLVKSRNRSSGDSFHTEESIVDPKPSENSIDETPEKLFKCSCGKAYTAPFRLRTHQRFSRNSQCSPEIKEFKEAKEKPKKSCGTYYCSDCNKYFNGHIALLNHQRWHANHSAKRFPCEKCGKVFTTLAFHYRHQRMVHSDEAPAKSFLHQVCQLQKKAFECKDCGLKFSRATALHSHQLHHTDVFRETEKLAQAHTPMPPQQKISEGKSKETGEEIEADYVLSTSTAEEDSHINGTDEDVESYEPGDFNVQVISASESEDEAAQDLNPDLELLCESDQEGRDEGETDISQSCLVSKPEMDLKIVQIDFDFSASEAENKPTAERFDCPDCYRWFSSASSLRVHRMWHGVHKRKQETKASLFNHMSNCSAQKEENVSITKKEYNPKKTLLGPKIYHCEHFAKVRGLRAHKWQAHSRAVKGKNKTVVGVQTESVASTYEVKNIEDTSSADSTTVISSVVTKKNGPVKKGRKKIKSEPVPVNAVLCLECGQFCSSVGALIDHNRVCQGIKQDLKREIHTPEVTAEVSPPNNRPPDQAAKYLFKCDKCGKAFQTEEHLATHKTKAKSRPYCCALCCHGFWTENQLQQHLAWHDEVRYRLPNEVRLRLSAAMTTKPLKTNLSLTHNTGKSLPSSTPNRPTPKNQSQRPSVKCRTSSTITRNVTVITNGGLTPPLLSHQEIPMALLALNVELLFVKKQICTSTTLNMSEEYFKPHLYQHSLEEEEEEEEEEEGQLGDDMNPECDRTPVRNLDKDEDGDWCHVASPQIEPLGAAVAESSVHTKCRSVYTCLVCGKIYTYLVSFRKHQQLHNKTIKVPESVQDLQTYECPYCGQLFVRQTRLLSHLMTHRPVETKPPRCDQCRRDFVSMETWMVHKELHKKLQFWCLMCAKGFKGEESLDVHLQRHHQGKYKCKICRKRFWSTTHLRHHYSKHQGSFRRNLLSHRKKHLGVLSLGNKNSADFQKTGEIKKRFFLSSDQEEAGIEGSLEKSRCGEEAWEQAHSDESDCGEPTHCIQVSKPSDMPAPDPSDEAKAETGPPSQEIHSDQEHKYWEWECFECDMGFDDVAKLHSHYIKHATGELPLPHDDFQD